MRRNYSGDSDRTHNVWNTNRVLPYVGKYLGAVSPEQVREFCTRFPGLDKEDGAAETYAYKILSENWAPDSPTFYDALKTCSGPEMMKDYSKYATANGMYNYSACDPKADYYALWHGVSSYEAFRKTHGYSGDNGWYKHGARLLCRVQAFYREGKIRAYKSRTDYLKRKLGEGVSPEDYVDMLEITDWPTNKPKGKGKARAKPKPSLALARAPALAPEPEPEPAPAPEPVARGASPSLVPRKRPLPEPVEGVLAMPAATGVPVAASVPKRKARRADEDPTLWDPPDSEVQLLRTAALCTELRKYLQKHKLMNRTGKKHWQGIKDWCATPDGVKRLRAAGLHPLSFHLHHVSSDAWGGHDCIYNCVFAPGNANSSWGCKDNDIMRAYVGELACKIAAHFAKWAAKPGIDISKYRYEGALM